MYILTDQTREIIAVALDIGKEGELFTCMLPGPGQRLHHLPDVPEVIKCLRDGSRFSRELTSYLRPRHRSSEIDTRQGNAFFKFIRDREAG